MTATHNALSANATHPAAERQPRWTRRALLGAGGLLATVPAPLRLADAAPALPGTPGTPGTPAVGADSLILTATFHSIGVEVLGTFPAAQAVEGLEFRRSPTPDSPQDWWRPGLPMWSAGDALYGSVLLCDAGTAYEIRVTLPDGAVRTGTIMTRQELAIASSLPAPSYFVSEAGNDTNPGTTPDAAWRTLERAVTRAPSDAVVQVGPGTFDRPRSARTLPLTLVAEFPAVDEAAAITNHGLHSVISFGRTTRPGDGAWRSITLDGPGLGGASAGQPHQCWTWTLPDRRPPSTIAYAATADAIPTRLALWDRKGDHLSTPAGFVEKVRTNRTYNVGWTSFPNPDGTHTLYAVFPEHVDPNALYVTAGEIPTSSSAVSASSLVIAGPDVRVSGFRIGCGRVTLTAASQRATLDHNFFELSLVKLEGSKPGAYGADHVIEHNRFVDTNTWTDDHRARPAIPWVFIKGGIQNADGSAYASPNGTAYGRLGAAAERTAIWNGGGALRVVIRRNTIEGVFNGIGGYGSGFDRNSARDNDVYENVLRRIADDAFEPEHAVINWRAWNNRIEDAAVVLSMGPVNYGPLYVVRNTAWRIGPAGTGRTNDGDPGASGKGIKYSGSSNPTARIFLLQNTWWTDDPGGGAGVSGAEQTAGGGRAQEAFFLRNNIFRFTKYAFAAPGGGRWDEAGNHFATSDQARGLEYAGRRFRDANTYASALGTSTGTNALGDFVTVALVDAALEDPTIGNLRLRPDSIFRGVGVPIPQLHADGGPVDLGA